MGEGKKVNNHHLSPTIWANGINYRVGATSIPSNWNNSLGKASSHVRMSALYLHTVYEQTPNTILTNHRIAFFCVCVCVWLGQRVFGKAGKKIVISAHSCIWGEKKSLQLTKKSYVQNTRRITLSNTEQLLWLHQTEETPRMSYEEDGFQVFHCFFPGAVGLLHKIWGQSWYILCAGNGREKLCFLPLEKLNFFHLSPLLCYVTIHFLSCIQLKAISFFEMCLQQSKECFLTLFSPC